MDELKAYLTDFLTKQVIPVNDKIKTIARYGIFIGVALTLVCILITSNSGGKNNKAKTADKSQSPEPGTN